MANPWLTVVGVGEEGIIALLPETQIKITQAALIIGGERHLKMLPDNLKAETMSWLSPLEQTIEVIKQHRGTPVVILASGDPMDFGIGVTLARHFNDDEMTVIPTVGSFSHALARLGWARHDTECLTLHGRPMTVLNTHLQPGNRLLLLAHDGSSPQQLAQYLCMRGFSRSAVTVLSHLSGAQESRQSFRADDNLAKQEFPDLSVMAVMLVLDDNAHWHSRASGINENAYRHQGKITKPEVRAATLAKLRPAPGALLWDLGAGSGSVAIEWARLGGFAIAVERDAARCRDIAENIERLGTEHIELIEGDIAAHLETLPPADAIFIGGGLSLELAQQCTRRLKPGGRLVVNAVTLESQMILLQWAEQHHGSLCRIAVGERQNIGAFHGFKPAMEVMQWAQEKSRG